VAISKQKEGESLEDLTDRPLKVYDPVFEILLFDPKTWKVKGRYDAFEPHEVILSMASVTMHGKEYIAIGNT